MKEDFIAYQGSHLHLGGVLVLSCNDIHEVSYSNLVNVILIAT